MTLKYSYHLPFLSLC